MRLAHVLGAALGAVVAATAVVPMVYAQGEGGGGSVYGGGSVQTFMRAGSAPRKVGTANCPAVMWDVTRSAGTDKNTINLSGPVWNLDGSGISMVNGTANASDGNFTATITRVQGNGPQGNVKGVRHKDGTVDMTVSGGGPCDNMVIHAKPGQTSFKPTAAS